MRSPWSPCPSIPVGRALPGCVAVTRPATAPRPFRRWRSAHPGGRLTDDAGEADIETVGFGDGIGLNVPPESALWWQSSDGRDWRRLDGYPPLGPRICTGEGCGAGPDGILVGDGQRMVAVRGGPDAAAWTSADGLAWRQLTGTGDLPDTRVLEVVLLPGGVLLSDGSTTWFGEALMG
jgi:hypothetical protein